MQHLVDFFTNRPIRNGHDYMPVASISTGEASAKCAMCVKKAVISDKHDNKNEKAQQQQQENDSTSSTMIVEQIDGTYYTFDTANCVLMFKKFNAIYGSNFADE
jgi:hypothetical protein